MAAELCCTECFEDEYLKRFIEENGETGDCAFCESEGVKCIWPGELTELFDPLIQLFEPLEIGVNMMRDSDPLMLGDPLADRIDYDWEIFSENLGDRKHDLLDEIVNAGNAPEDMIDLRQFWTEVSKSFLHHSLEDHWHSFANHLRHVRRYIPNPDLADAMDSFRDPRTFLDNALQKVDRVIASGTEVFRARAGYNTAVWRREPYPANEMGAPPPHLATAGRMNPAGIAYLYLALSEYTAAAEIRPWKGSFISIAKFVMPKDFRVADLTDIPYIPTPFGRDNLALEVEERHLLKVLGEELGRPVNPDTAHTDYVPTQYLTEFIQDLGFEAIQYPSALGREPNLVIFDHKELQPESVWLREVDDISYKLKRLGRRELLSD